MGKRIPEVYDYFFRIHPDWGYGTYPKGLPWPWMHRLGPESNPRNTPTILPVGFLLSRHALNIKKIETKASCPSSSPRSQDSIPRGELGLLQATPVHYPKRNGHADTLPWT
jgi:hypothetical protein